MDSQWHLATGVMRFDALESTDRDREYQAFLNSLQSWVLRLYGLSPDELGNDPAGDDHAKCPCATRPHPCALVLYTRGTPEVDGVPVDACGSRDASCNPSVSPSVLYAQPEQHRKRPY